MLLFLNISGGEVVVIFLIILMLFGPQSIPTIARTLGRGIRTIKDAAGEIQNEIKKSADKNDIASTLDISSSLETPNTISQPPTELDLSKELDISRELDEPGK